jgi:hypothetical protein
MHRDHYFIRFLLGGMIYIAPCLGTWDTQFGLLTRFITILTTITYNTITYFHLNSLKYTAG